MLITGLIQHGATEVLQHLTLERRPLLVLGYVGLGPVVGEKPNMVGAAIGGDERAPFSLHLRRDGAGGYTL
jgi:hypothetical protein